MDKPTLEVLFDRAVSNLSHTSVVGSLAQGKMFELYALLVVLRRLRACGFSVIAKNCVGNFLRLPGAPAIPNKLKYSYFEIADSAGCVRYEVWQSIEVETLSHTLSGATATTSCSFHEVDVGVYAAPLASGIRPDFRQLMFAATCKFRPINKEQIREALGFRRETAFLHPNTPSLAPWFIAAVPADPPSPIVFFSKDPASNNYVEPVDRLGVYVRQLAMP